MDQHLPRFSPSEKKALEFATMKHKGQKRIGGDDYITHPLSVALFLYGKGYRGKYVFTALCHDLLEDTDASSEEIFECCGRFTRDAVELLTKSKGIDIQDYLNRIKENEIAYHVKVADRIMNLIDAKKADASFREQYLLETEQYYLNFAEASPFKEDLLNAYESLKYHNHELSRIISLEANGCYRSLFDDSDFNILDGFHYGSVSFPIACLMNSQDIEEYNWEVGEEISLTISAVPASDFEIFNDEEGYYKAYPEGFASQSFSPSPEFISFNDNEIPAPEACFTGVVKETYLPLEDTDGDSVYPFDIQILDIIITILINKNQHKLPEIGNVVFGVFRLYGYIEDIV